MSFLLIFYNFFDVSDSNLGGSSKPPLDPPQLVDQTGGGYAGFCRMKWLQVFLHPKMGYKSITGLHSICWYPFYTTGWKDTVSVKSLADRN